MSNRQAATLASELEADLYLPSTATKDEPAALNALEAPASLTHHALSHSSLMGYSATPASCPQQHSRRFHEHVKSLSPYEGGLMYTRPASQLLERNHDLRSSSPLVKELEFICGNRRSKSRSTERMRGRHDRSPVVLEGSCANCAKIT